MILYQDRRMPRPTAHRTPVHLQGALTLTRQDCVSGDLLTLGEPLGSLEVPGEDAPFIDLPDDWRCWLIGDFVPTEHLRRGAGTLDLLPVSDAKGRTWHTPAVLAPGVDPLEGTPVLRLAWGLVDKVPARIPTPEQARLISAARSARLEILGKRISQVPITVAAEWATVLTEAAYHLVREQIFGWQLLDDQLVAGQLLASAGFMRPMES